MPEREHTISDVAALAGVSRSSVSRYLNGHRVRQADLIASAITEFSYEPSPIARSLRSGRTQSVGVIVADVANPFFASAFNSVMGPLPGVRCEHVQLRLATPGEGPGMSRAIATCASWRLANPDRVKELIREPSKPPFRGSPIPSTSNHPRLGVDSDQHIKPVPGRAVIASLH